MTQQNLSRSIVEIATHLHAGFHVEMAKVAVCRVDFANRQCCVVWRSLADWSEAWKGNRRIGRKAIAGGQDKSPQCAGRFGCGFAWISEVNWQCSPPIRNVHERLNPLSDRSILNIAEAGHGT
ncbi:MAG TPA: hypothetical protein VFG62_19810 [Rhodopila sp.]|jgi:hypothetical protein|nr:hypothetical protein [Rhodopila sp.]